MNRNYVRGRNKEWELIRFIKQIYPDAVTCRAAGSHGQYDVYAYLPSERRIFLIQVKSHSGAKNLIIKEDERVWVQLSRSNFIYK